MDERIASILERYPFLSFGTLLDTSYLGIVQNSDGQLISMYVLDAIPTEAGRRLMLRYGEDWWWGSNRQIPINIFIGAPFRVFRPFLKHFSRKDFDFESGPQVSLQETISRRVRRRQVMLVRKQPV
jgi:hypothetical protein